MNLAGEIGRVINDVHKQVEQATRGITSGTFTVTKDNVLAAARIIEEQADSLRDQVKDVHRELHVRPPGDDIVSIRVSAAWNAILLEDDDSYRNRISDYVAGLRRLAVQLGDSAKTYGYTEDEIAAAFGRHGA